MTRLIRKETHEDELPWLRNMKCDYCGFAVPIAILYPVGHCRICGRKEWVPA